MGATSHIPDNPGDLNDTRGMHISAIAVLVLLVMGGVWFMAIALLWGISRFTIGQGKYASLVIRVTQGILLLTLGVVGAVAAFEYGADGLKRMLSCVLFVLLIGLAFVPFRLFRD
ncbi:hypothetical protein D3C77_597870 [compost metagenome]